MDDDFNLIEYSSPNYVNFKVDRKNTLEYCQYLGHSLVSWNLKKQSSVALSTVEAKYITVGRCWVQTLGISKQLRDLGFDYKELSIRSDNMSVDKYHKEPYLAL